MGHLIMDHMHYYHQYWGDGSRGSDEHAGGGGGV